MHMRYHIPPDRLAKNLQHLASSLRHGFLSQTSPIWPSNVWLTLTASPPQIFSGGSECSILATLYAAYYAVMPCFSLPPPPSFSLWSCVALNCKPHH